MPAILAIAGQQTGIDGIGLGEASEGTRKAPDLEGVGAMAGDAGSDQFCGELPLIAARGLEHRKAACIEPGKKGPDVRRAVGDGFGAAGAGIEKRDAVLRDIEADDVSR